jgi:hypothetical protein
MAFLTQQSAFQRMKLPAGRGQIHDGGRAPGGWQRNGSTHERLLYAQHYPMNHAPSELTTKEPAAIIFLPLRPVNLTGALPISYEIAGLGSAWRSADIPRTSGRRCHDTWRTSPLIVFTVRGNGPRAQHPPTRGTVCIGLRRALPKLLFVCIT